MRLPRRKPKVKTEKLTISLTPAEVGQIDYLVERGLYTNRSDYIRLAIRKQAESHAQDIDQFISPTLPETPALRYMGGLGLVRLTRAYVEGLEAIGAKVNISVIGALSIDKLITPDQISQTVASVKVHGKIFADEAIRQVLPYR